MFAACPDISNLQSLLEDGAGDDESAEMVAHLETCADCQQTLETLAGNPCAWEDAARGLVKRSRTESALRGMVERLKSEKPVPAEDDLSSFLCPADKPGLLGMLGPYEVEEQIGRGGMGVVLKARDPALNRVVAIKVLSLRFASSATARRRFVREGRSAAAVCHEHIVAIHGVNEANGFPYLVMQYIAGESLQDRLDRTGPMRVEEILQAGVQIASGLAAAHAHGLIHRDIKPANLLLSFSRDAESSERSAPSGDRHALRSEDSASRLNEVVVKITDFGLARMTDDVNLTQNGVLLGTPEYMAPEQARGEIVDHRADLFSLGSVLYTMSTGVPPFHGSTTHALIQQVIEGAPAPMRALNPNVPAWLEALVARLMAKDPAERFQSAAEVEALLEGHLAHLHRPATVPAPELPLQPARTPTKRTQRRTPLLAWVGAVAVLSVLALGLGVSLWPLGARVAAPDAEQRPMKEIYQDFRGGKAFRSEFRLGGAADAGKVTKLEPGGLRITLPAARPQHLPIEVCAKFSLFGDFDVTGTYELLSAAVPAKGYGVGVALIVANSDKRDKFVKVGRLMRPDKGSVYFSEFWTRKPPEDYQLGSQPTEVRAGQLRIVRVGAHLRCLVADEVGKDFTLVFEVPDFGTEEMAQLRFEVTDGCSPNNPVDARLVDVRVRMQTFPPDNGAGPAPLPPQTPIRADNPTPAEAQSARWGWLAATLVAGFVFTFLLAGAGALLVFLRQRNASTARNQPAAFVSFACPGCGQKLKIEAKLANKKVKCPACGDAVKVPETAPPVPRARRSKFMLWPSVLLGFVLVSLVLVGVWFFLPEKSEWLGYPSDRDAVRARGLLDQPLGFDEVGGVEESGFYRMEGGGNTNTLSYRWTNGAAKMVVPIGEVSPKALTAVLGLEASTPFRLAIHVNGFSLFDEKITHRGVWTRSFDLEDAPKRKDMVIDIQSDVFIPSQQTGGKNNDSRQLGVRIYGITLLSGKKEYLNVPLGGAFVPGVEDSGFHKAYKEGDSYVRWTTGAAQLKVPIRQKRPKALAVTMDIPKQLKDRIEIVVNKRKLLDEPVEAKTNWTRRIPLDGVDVQDQLLIELRSSTWVPSQIDAASKVAPVLGVRVKKVLLLEE